MNNQELKVFTIILVVATIVITLMGGTLAYWNWQSTSAQNTNVTFTVASNFSCSADGGGNITNNDVMIVPATCTNSAHAIKRQVKVNVNKNGTSNIYLDMYLNVNSIGTGLSNTTNFKYALTTSGTNCTDGVVAQGNFSGATTNTHKKLFSLKEYTQTTQNDTYYLWIWLDAAETSASTQNQSFDLSLAGSCTDQNPYVYTANIFDENATNNNSVVIGSSIPNTITKYNTPDAAITALENAYQAANSGATASLPFFLKHTVSNDIVTESYVGFVVTPTMASANPGMVAGTYYLKGGDNGASFVENAKTIYDAFGGVGCYLDGNSGGNPYTTTPSSNFHCVVSGLRADAYSSGDVGASDDAGSGCNVNEGGNSDCGVFGGGWE